MLILNIFPRLLAILALPEPPLSLIGRRTRSSCSLQMPSIPIGTGLVIILSVRRWGTGLPSHWADPFHFLICNV